MSEHWTKPIFTTGTAASILEVNPKTLINYDNWGLFTPQRSATGRRLYSRQDLYEIMAIRYLLEEVHLTINAAKLVLDLVNKALEKGVDLREEILPQAVQQKIQTKIP